VLSKELDAELAELHAVVEESWTRITNLTALFRATGAAVNTLPGASIPSAGFSNGGAQPATAPAVPAAGGLSPISLNGQSGGAATASAAVGQMSADVQSEIRKLEAEFRGLQDTAFRIGRESTDNQELAKHPDVNNYVQGMRSFKPKLESVIGDLEREYKRATGKELDKPKKKRKRLRRPSAACQSRTSAPGRARRSPETIGRFERRQWI
jgi:hypothetical protein